LADGYNSGEQLGIEQAVEQGYMKRPRKKSLDAGDQRVCYLCHSLNEQIFDLDEDIIPGRKNPPYHPHCRDVCVYIEE
jgi:hypothetical protein